MDKNIVTKGLECSNSNKSPYKNGVIVVLKDGLVDAVLGVPEGNFDVIDHNGWDSEEKSKAEAFIGELREWAADFDNFEYEAEAFLEGWDD